MLRREKQSRVRRLSFRQIFPAPDSCFRIAGLVRTKCIHLTVQPQNKLFNRLDRFEIKIFTTPMMVPFVPQNSTVFQPAFFTVIPIN
jgi:hypothetical protein